MSICFMEIYQKTMAIEADDLIEITLNMLVLNQVNNLVFQYYVVDWPGSVSAVQGAEGWWNHVKATTRGLAGASWGNVFKTVKIRELNNPAGAYAEYDIPLSEQVGTRGSGTGDQMPPYVAVGVRLVVGERVTRPGQKRIPFLVEGDNNAGILGSAMQTAVVNWANVITANMLLGAPAALVSLAPQVVRKDSTGFVTANQAITGYLINPNLTTQNSRKYGRGI